MSAPLFYENGSETEESASARFCNRSIWWLQFATDVELCLHNVAAQTLKGGFTEGVGEGDGFQTWSNDIYHSQRMIWILIAGTSVCFWSSSHFSMRFFSAWAIGSYPPHSTTVLTLTDNTRRRQRHLHFNRRLVSWQRRPDLWSNSRGKQQKMPWACYFATACLLEWVAQKSYGLNFSCLWW